MITVKKTEKRAEKENAIILCDDAFPHGLTKRSDYEQILDKICCYADFFIAYTGEEVAGYAAMYDNDIKNKTAYITMIGVREKFQRHHIGSKLMDSCINAARQHSMQVIRLEVLSTNEKAITFYKNHHFLIEKPCSESSIYMTLIL